VVLHHLTEHIGISAYLGLLRDERVTVVEVAESPGSPYLEDFEVGLDISAHATALGKALLPLYRSGQGATFGSDTASFRSRPTRRPTWTDWRTNCARPASHQSPRVPTRLASSWSRFCPRVPMLCDGPLAGRSLRSCTPHERLPPQAVTFHRPPIL
jgi:hypothetical protein